MQVRADDGQPETIEPKNATNAEQTVILPIAPLRALNLKLSAVKRRNLKP